MLAISQPLVFGKPCVLKSSAITTTRINICSAWCRVIDNKIVLVIIINILSLGLPLHLSETNTPMSTAVASLSCLEGGSGDSDGVMLFEDKGKAEERGGELSGDRDLSGEKDEILDNTGDSDGDRWRDWSSSQSLD